MATCAGCGTSILFGGVSENGLRFCGKNCHEQNANLVYVQGIADTLDDDDVWEFVEAARNAPCPKCQGPGPVDIHVTHSVWSALVVTSWKSTPEVSCQGCGTKSRLTAILTAGLVGWWGFPWGIMMTPVQIGRNLLGLTKAIGDRPSPEFERIIRRQLAGEIYIRSLQEGDQDVDSLEAPARGTA